MDGWIVNKIDTAMLAIQKRGLSLVSIRCWSITAVLFSDAASHIVEGSTSRLLLFGALWSVFCFVRYHWASTANDYQENWRTANRLNGDAMFYRDHSKMRVVFGLSIILMTGIVDIPKLFTIPVFASLDILVTILVIIDQYLCTATYLTGLPRAKTEDSADLAKQRI